MSRRAPKPKITPWPNSTFALKTTWEDAGLDKHLRVHLERRAAGKFGRLEAMLAIVPRRPSKAGGDELFASARYRKATLDHARSIFARAGVPEAEAESYMATICRQFPYPTAEELFLEEINRPVFAIPLGARHKELSYFRTGIPELKAEDLALIKECAREFEARINDNPDQRNRLLNAFFGRDVVLAESR